MRILLLFTKGFEISNNKVALEIFITMPPIKSETIIPNMLIKWWKTNYFPRALLSFITN